MAAGCPLVKVLLYGYAVGVRSSRKLSRACLEDVAFRVLCAGNEPDFRTINAFRKRHLTALSDLFTRVLMLAREAGLIKLGHVAIDGTKVRANASKHKAMSYGRMVEEEERLRAEVEQLLAASEAEDAAEDERYGPDVRGDELPEELRHREGRLKKIRHREWRDAKPPTEPLPEGSGVRERMRHRLRTERGRAEYDKRKITVEPTIGQLKDVIGMRQFLLRGLANVKREWRLACTAHNLLKLWRAVRSGMVRGALAEGRGRRACAVASAA